MRRDGRCGGLRGQHGTDRRRCCDNPAPGDPPMEQGAGSGHTAADRADRAAEPLRGPVVGHPFQVAQDDRRPEPLGQPGQLLVHHARDLDRGPGHPRRPARPPASSPPTARDRSGVAGRPAHGPRPGAPPGKATGPASRRPAMYPPCRPGPGTWPGRRPPRHRDRGAPGGRRSGPSGRAGPGAPRTTPRPDLPRTGPGSPDPTAPPASRPGRRATTCRIAPLVRPFTMSRLALLRIRQPYLCAAGRVQSRIFRPAGAIRDPCPDSRGLWDVYDASAIWMMPTLWSLRENADDAGRVGERRLRGWIGRDEVDRRGGVWPIYSANGYPPGERIAPRRAGQRRGATTVPPAKDEQLDDRRPVGS